MQVNEAPTAEGVPIIPVPVRAEWRTGSPFALTADVRVVLDGPVAVLGVAARVASVLGRLAGAEVPVVAVDDGAPGRVVLRLPADAAGLGLHRVGLDRQEVESYRLEVGPEGVVVTAGGPEGLLHAIASLEQLVRLGADGVAVVPPVLVEDAPRFGWRGLSVDVGKPPPVDPPLAVVGPYAGPAVPGAVVEIWPWRGGPTEPPWPQVPA